ncbi:MAG: ABC transporter substrate-binding protein [Proteobacteria bacterium]|nr:ABC transporter substrate-binding protein [Pseudomonadota bacterium]
MKLTIKRSTAGLVLALVTLVVLFSTAPARAELKLRLEWLPSGIHAWYHLAQIKGWHKDAGVDLKIDDGTGSGVAVQLVGARNYDLGTANLGTMAVAVGKGVPVKAVAILFRRNQMGILVPKGSGWKSPKDLVDNNVKIVTTPGGFDTPFLKPFFHNAGTDLAKATIVNVGAPQKGSTYINKGADAMVSSPPYFTPMLARSRPSDAIMMYDFGLEIPANGLFAHEDTIR